MRVRYIENENSYEFQIIGSPDNLKYIIQEYDLINEHFVISTSLASGEGEVYGGSFSVGDTQHEPLVLGKHVEPSHLYTFLDAYDMVGMIFWIYDSDKAFQIKLKYANRS